MNCALCFDDGKEVEMIHKTGESMSAGDYQGNPYYSTACWLECPECGHQEECDRSCVEPTEDNLPD